MHILINEILTNVLLLAIPSGMRIIFQPLCLFPRLEKYFQFYKNTKNMYVSWLPLANKSILSQGHCCLKCVCGENNDIFLSATSITHKHTAATLLEFLFMYNKSSAYISSPFALSRGIREVIKPRDFRLVHSLLSLFVAGRQQLYQTLKYEDLGFVDICRILCYFFISVFRGG